jgi:hypothetical protein
VQREPEIGVLDERIETKRTVARPLHQHAVTRPAHLRLDEPGTLPEHRHAATSRQQQRTIRLPRCRHGLVGVVEDVEVAQESRGTEQFVQRGFAREVALAALPAVCG